jgi:HEAT repeat protein
MLAIWLGTGEAIHADDPDREASAPAPLNLEQADAEVAARYAGADPDIREYVAWTARTFGPGGKWLNENAFEAWPEEAREEKVLYLAKLLEEGEYGRYLCRGLAEASALRDPRLVPGLLKVAAHHVEGGNYDCRPKWMAVAALARQESDEAVPLLISLVDHGNQNTRTWARAALARKTGRDFKTDKRVWAGWWEEQGHDPVAEQYLATWEPVEEDR